MKAWIHTKAGVPSDVLSLTADLPTPQDVGPNEVLIKINYAALNPGASLMIHIVPFLFRTKPSIPDIDFSGTITKVGNGVSIDRQLTVGTAVFGSIPVSLHVGKGSGSMAEYVVIPAENVCIKPDNVPYDQAAGLGIAGCTAIAFLDIAKLKEGDKVLVNGASGGCGILMVQMAKIAVGPSGKVVGICSGRNAEMVRGLGADEIIDYQKHSSIPAYLKDVFGNDQFDVIVDAIGVQEIFNGCADYLKPGKTYISVGAAAKNNTVYELLCAVKRMIGNFLWPRILGGVNRTYSQLAVTANLKDMERLAKMAAEGKLKIPIDSSWEMEEALKAYEKMLSKRARGKIVVKIS